MKITSLPEIHLAKASLFKLNGDRRGTVIFCLSGTSWITQENDLADYFLRAGERFVISRAGLVLLQAVTDVDIHIRQGRDGMFIEHHFDREKSSGRRTSIMTTWWPVLLIAVFSSLILLWWVMPAEVASVDVPSWKLEFQQAEFWRQNGSPSRATLSYGRAFRIAALSDDWEGLIAVACGLTAIGRIKDSGVVKPTVARVFWSAGINPTGSGVTAKRALTQAMVAAERKQSGAGLKAVANALIAVGETSIASDALSRIREDWPNGHTGSIDHTRNVCEDNNVVRK